MVDPAVTHGVQDRRLLGLEVELMLPARRGLRNAKPNRNPSSSGRCCAGPNRRTTQNRPNDETRNHHIDQKVMTTLSPLTPMEGNQATAEHRSLRLGLLDVATRPR